MCVGKGGGGYCDAELAEPRLDEARSRVVDSNINHREKNALRILVVSTTKTTQIRLSLNVGKGAWLLV